MIPNPLEILRSFQDWFIRSERSSGFRPLLVLIFICFTMAIVLLTLFSGTESIVAVAVCLLLGPVGVFLVIYILKAFQEPDFCRSEVHVERMARIEMERLGSDADATEAMVIDDDPELLPDSSIGSASEGLLGEETK